MTYWESKFMTGRSCSQKKKTTVRSTGIWVSVCVRTFFVNFFLWCIRYLSCQCQRNRSKVSFFCKKAKTENGQYRSQVTDGSLILLLRNWLVENWSFIILGVIFINIKPILVNWLDPEICMTLFYNLLKTY